jgi:hypothetical protein
VFAYECTSMNPRAQDFENKQVGATRCYRSVCSDVCVYMMKWVVVAYAKACNPWGPSHTHLSIGADHHQAVASCVTLGDGVREVIHKPDIIVVINRNGVRTHKLRSLPPPPLHSKRIADALSATPRRRVAPGPCRSGAQGNVVVSVLFNSHAG